MQGEIDAFGGKAKHNCQVGSYVLRISSLRGVNQDVDAGCAPPISGVWQQTRRQKNRVSMVRRGYAIKADRSPSFSRAGGVNGGEARASERRKRHSVDSR